MKFRPRPAKCGPHALPTAAAVCLAPALLRATGLTVDSFLELPLVALGTLLFFTAQTQPHREQRRADDEPL